MKTNSQDSYHLDNSYESNIISELILNENEKDSSKNFESTSDTTFGNGKWSNREHARFILGIIRYGNDWNEVEKMIVSRSSIQSRSHSQKFFGKLKKMKIFEYFKHHLKSVKTVHEACKNMPTDDLKILIFNLINAYDMNTEEYKLEQDEVYRALLKLHKNCKLDDKEIIKKLESFKELDSFINFCTTAKWEYNTNHLNVVKTSKKAKIKNSTSIKSNKSKKSNNNKRLKFVKIKKPWQILFQEKVPDSVYITNFTNHDTHQTSHGDHISRAASFNNLEDSYNRNYLDLNLENLGDNNVFQEIEYFDNMMSVEAFTFFREDLNEPENFDELSSYENEEVERELFGYENEAVLKYLERT